MSLVEAAPAKVNLALHVVGRRADGYHLLDTLVAFPAIGDTLAAGPAEDWSLAVDGPTAAAIAGLDPESNLVMRAARALAPLAGARARPLAFRLVKRLPVEAGIGGGSADGAAAIRLACRAFGLDPAAAPVREVAAALGADVPMCLAGVPLRARGVGERLDPVGGLPPLGIVLANPRVAVPTPAVFRALARRDNAPLPEPVDTAGPAAFLAWLARCRNDMQDAAVALAPAIGEALAAAAALPGCRLARMSGSGATVFALFDDAAAAGAAADRLAADRPGWWIAAAPLSSPG